MAAERVAGFGVEQAPETVRGPVRSGLAGAVLHPYHYALLCTELALDAARCDGPRLLSEAAESAFYRQLDRHCREHGARATAERLAAAREAWRRAGMGRVEFPAAGSDGLTAVMDRSLVDICWVRRWGRPDGPVNHIGRGFVAAVAAIVSELPPGLFVVEECASLARGDAASVFRAAIK
ncbi:MAG: hypothetical protein ACYDIE_02725 [Candidatus Krumholzibacteriia bacterium]